MRSLLRFLVLHGIFFHAFLHRIISFLERFINILKANLCFTHGIGHYLTFVFFSLFHFFVSFCEISFVVLLKIYAHLIFRDRVH